MLVENDFSDLPNVGNTVELDKKFDVAIDTNKDGIVDEEEEKKFYETTNGKTHTMEIHFTHIHGLIGQKEKDGLTIELQ